MQSILLTFDYELPLGGVLNNYEESLFKPTDQLMKSASKMDVPLVFFVDILCYIQFKNNRLDQFCDRFKQQVQQMILDGHDVQLHLHPHWLKTKIKDNQFVTDAPFSLSDYSDTQIQFFIQTGVESLNKMVQEVKNEYQCVAFRAGGYNFGTKQALIVDLLFQHGIRFDASIAKGYYFKSDTSVVDYRHCPENPHWFLKGINPKHQILEIPIASKPKSWFEIPTFLKLKWYKSRSVDRGKMIHTFTQYTRNEKWNQFLSSRMLTIDNYTFSLSFLLTVIHYQIKIHKNIENSAFCLIGHPKAMGLYSLELLENLIKKIQYNNDLNIITFNSIENIYKENESN
ncbi:MAG: putative xylanase/chitin deacetylase [Bacteroidetes bacterium]|nr:putative xylanase/chitin deacetylase [Bacteroidota bacterium]